MKRFFLLFLLAPLLALHAETKSERLAKLKELNSKLQYKTGEIDLKNGLAKLNLSDNFRYLSPDDSEIVLHQMWDNPADDKTLGMIFPSNLGPLDGDAWAVIITYADDGYVKDSDADKINYNDLLKQMQDSTKEHNKEREKEGYPAIELVGWAAPPRYDKDTHKMYWAKEIKFSDSKENTLNYNIRVLGRRGVLVLNAVAGMSDFKVIEKHTPEIVSMVDFKEGNRYAEFNDKTDKVAAYGLAALVAGGLAAKAGLFKMLWVGLLAAKKFVIVACVAIAGFFKKLFSRKESA